jgi:hypothetical protein
MPFRKSAENRLVFCYFIMKPAVRFVTLHCAVPAVAKLLKHLAAPAVCHLQSLLFAARNQNRKAYFLHGIISVMP